MKRSKTGTGKTSVEWRPPAAPPQSTQDDDREGDRKVLKDTGRKQRTQVREPGHRGWGPLPAHWLERGV